MRSIAKFKEEKLALRFWNYLQTIDIESSLEEDDIQKEWHIWVLDEEKLDLSISEKNEFVKNPDNPKYITNGKKAINEKQDEVKAKSRYKDYNLKDKWFKQESRLGMVSLALIITSVAVFLISGTGKNYQVIGPFLISEKNDIYFSEFLSGQLWRIVTPIFLHFGFLHIIFNMYWLYYFGCQIEKRKGSAFIAIFIFLTAIFSNIAQYLVTGPEFGGMSGVVYALLGYIWIKSKFDPGDGLYIEQSTALVLVAWLLLCFVMPVAPGFSGGVANWAHTGGLISGAGWGYISAIRWNRK
jgi:GlpG protein